MKTSFRAFLALLSLLVLSHSALAEPSLSPETTAAPQTFVYHDLHFERPIENLNESLLSKSQQEKLINLRLNTETTNATSPLNGAEQELTSLSDRAQLTGFQSKRGTGISSYSYGLNPSLYPYGYGHGLPGNR